MLQLWSAAKEDQAKQTSQDPDSLEDVESSMMDCDPHERLDFSEDKLFKVSLTYITQHHIPLYHFTLCFNRVIF